MKLLSKTQMNDLFEKFTPPNGNIIAETACGHEGDTKKLKSQVLIWQKAKHNCV